MAWYLTPKPPKLTELMSGQIASTVNLAPASAAVTPKVKDRIIDVQLITTDELCGELADRWNTLRQSAEHLSSPYFLSLIHI